MKKLLSLSLICLGIMGGAWGQTCTTTITTFPYSEGFEGTTHGWTTTGTNNSWTLGTPAKTVISSAAAGTKSWATNLTGLYNANEDSYVHSPCFNLTGLITPVVEMKVWWNSESGYDGAVLQSSINGGTSWQNVGALNDPNNWYNRGSFLGPTGPGGQTNASAHGWSGRNSTSNGSGGWVTAKHALTGLGGQTNVRFRIAFFADAIIHDDGFAFDNFTIYDTPANDASVAVINSPTTPVTPTVPTPVQVTVKNFGTSPLASATLGFRVNNGPVTTVAHTFTSPLALNTSSAPISIGNHSFAAGTYTVKAWTQMPNGVADGLPFNDTVTVTVTACNGISGNLTINKNAPASATNFTSFASAVQAMSGCGISGSVIFDVVTGSGPYNEKVTIGNILGTSATKTVTFQGNGNTVTSPLTSTDALIMLNGSKYIRFNNLLLSADPGSTQGTGIYLSNGAQFNNFTNNTVSLSTSTASTSYCVRLETGLNTGNLFQNNIIKGGYYGINTIGTATTGSNNNQYIGNQIRDPYAYGINFYFANNNLIEGNDISRPTRTNGNFVNGIYLSNAIGNTISKNRIHNLYDATTTQTGTAYGIYLSSAAATVGNENVIRNNAIYNIIPNNGSAYAFYNSVGDGAHYSHNTVALHNPNFTGTGSVYGMYFGSASTNVKFINNIVSIDAGNTGTKVALYLSNSAISLISNNNNLYAVNGHVGFHTSNKTTLADWKAANSNAYDQNSISTAPMYINLVTGNLKPNNSTLNNTGAALTPPVTDDITGAARNATTPDAGAYEFTTPTTNDAGVVAFTSPTSPVTPGLTQVQVTIKNYGLAPLTSASITWTVNTVAQTPYAWTGNLPSGQTSAPITIGNYNLTTGVYTLNACTATPNGATDENTSNDCFTTSPIFACSALAGTYTIDKGNPASATNFVSLTDAAQRLNNCGIAASVVFDVAAGSGPYNEQMVLGAINGVSATKTITFNGNGNTINGTPVGTNLGIVTLDGADFVKIDNFILNTDATATSGWGVQLMNAANNNTISNNTINLPLTSSLSNINGIGSGMTISTAGNNASNNKIQNNTINGGYYGIRLNGNTGGLDALNNQITGNTIKDFYIYGIYLVDTDGTVVQGNDISRPTRNAIGFAFYGVYTLNVNKNLVISKNRIHNAFGMALNTTSAAYGIYFGDSDAPVGSENIVKNNLIYDIINNGSVYGIYNYGSNGAHYYHNTINLDNPAYSSTATYYYLRGFTQSTAATNIKFINNIITLNAGGTSPKHLLNFEAPTSAIVSNNNNLFISPTTTNAYVGYHTSDKTTLADWKAANSNAYDQASVSALSNFVNAASGNFRPNTVALDNIGQPTPVTDDIDGTLRTAATPDLGAYEFGVPANDVSVTAISGPVSGCSLTANETITITIRNFGSATQTSIPAKFKVNNVAIDSATWTGSLTPNATASFVFTQKANLATNGAYVIMAQTGLITDTNPVNNAFTINVANSLIPSLPITFGFETPANSIDALRTVDYSNSNITEGTAAGNGSTKGMIMDGVDAVSWVTPAGLTNPWSNNSNHFTAAYLCFAPAPAATKDTLRISFDLKQLYKTSHYNTNFRVTVNGQQVGKTYNPPFGGYDSLGATWTHVEMDISSYLNNPTIEIGLESSVKEAYANGAGTANLIDNIELVRVAGPTAPTGMKDNALQANVNVYPNPSNGIFNVDLPKGKTYELVVTDLSGKVLKKQAATDGASQLNLEGAAKGIYLLKVSGENGSAVRKLIVE